MPAQAVPGLPRPEDATRCTVLLRDWDAAPDLAQQWNAAVDRSPAAGVFQTFEWHRCWWKAFGGEEALFVVLAFAGSRLVGVAPMAIGRENRGGLRGTAIQFIGSANNASDYCDFIVDREFPMALETLLDEICSARDEFDAIHLSHFPRHSPHRRRTLEYFRRRGLKASCEAQEAAPVRILGNLESDRKIANKAKLKQQMRFFRKNGDLRFHRCASTGEILGWLDDFFEQHKARRAMTDSPSQFDDPAQRNFYRSLVRELAPRGWLRFDVVVFDGDPIAFHFGFEYRGGFIFYKPTFDVRLASRSPGIVLIKFLIDDAIERRLREFDFTVGPESYKYRFANETRYIDRVIAFFSPIDFWRHRLGRQIRHLARPVVRRLRCMLPSH